MRTNFCCCSLVGSVGRYSCWCMSRPSWRFGMKRLVVAAASIFLLMLAVGSSRADYFVIKVDINNLDAVTNPPQPTNPNPKGGVNPKGGPMPGGMMGGPMPGGMMGMPPG